MVVGGGFTPKGFAVVVAVAAAAGANANAGAVVLPNPVLVGVAEVEGTAVAAGSADGVVVLAPRDRNPDSKSRLTAGVLGGAVVLGGAGTFAGAELTAPKAAERPPRENAGGMVGLPVGARENAGGMVGVPVGASDSTLGMLGAVGVAVAAPVVGGASEAILGKLGAREGVVVVAEVVAGKVNGAADTGGVPKRLRDTEETGAAALTAGAVLLAAGREAAVVGAGTARGIAAGEPVTAAPAPLEKARTGLVDGGSVKTGAAF